MASIYESVVSILKQPVTPKGTTVRDTLVESNGLARPTKDAENIDEAARYHMANEDRLDELSPQLLKRYIKKAKEDHFQHSDAADEYGFEAQHQDRPSEVREYRNAAKAELAKAHKRLAGVHIARYHMANEDQLDELSPITLRDYIRAAGEDAALSRGEADFNRGKFIGMTGRGGGETPNETRARERSRKRLHGLHIASSKLAHKAIENEDQLDELSPITLRDYIRAAGEDAALSRGEADFNRGKFIGMTGRGGGETPNETRARERSRKRLHGLHIASSKLAHMANEDRLDELSPEAKKRYMKSAIDSVLKHGDQAINPHDYIDGGEYAKPDQARNRADYDDGERKLANHLIGLSRASKQQNEDRLDELSPQLLKRYIKKAKEDHFQHSDAADEYGFEAQHQDRPSEVREYRNAAKAELAKAHKRLAGVHIARYHMANEDRLDELSPELKRRYAKAAAADLADTAEKHAASNYVSSDFDDIIDNRLRGLKRLGAGKEARRLEKASYYVGSTDDGYDAQDRARKKLLRKFDESVLESVEFNALIESTAEVLSEAASRKDYVAVAKILHDAGAAGDDQFESPAHAAGYRRAIKHLGVELADHFKRDNSAFSHDRFRKAAGLDDVER